MENGPSGSDRPRLPLRHAVEALRIDVAVPDRDTGYALMERVGETNRARWLPRIERIFDEFDRPDELIRIDRLDLDLGRLAETELGEAEERLAEALRAALRRAMPPRKAAAADAAPTGSTAAIVPLAEALVGLLEHYLLRGVWPYAAGLDVYDAPADLLERLIQEQPAALVAMLRRHAASEPLLRRLAWQMPSPLLERLLRRLEPRDGGWILTYLAQTRAAHAAQPLLDEPPDSFSRRLWTIVLRDSLHRAGLHANRRAFLRSLIGRMAEAGPATYAELLAQFRRGLVGIPSAGRQPGSLLHTLEELGQEQSKAEAGAALPFAAAAAWLEGRAGWRVHGGRGEGGRDEDGRNKVGQAPDPPPTSAEAASLVGALGKSPAQARALMQRLAASGEPALQRRLQALLESSGVAERLASLWERSEPVGATASPFESPLARLERLLESACSGGAERAALLAALAEASRSDPIGTRRSLRLFAAADAAGLVESLKCSGSLAAALQWLMPRPSAWALAALIETAGCSPAEAAGLVRRVVELPVAAAPATTIAAALEALAELRGKAPAVLRPELLRLVERTGGAEAHELVSALAAAEEPSPSSSRAWRRLRLLDSLRALLHAPGRLGPPLPAPGLSSLSGIGGEVLREHLDPASLDRRDAEAALRELSRGDLVRLILLLAPRFGAGRSALRRRLASARGHLDLAAAAAELLVTGAVGEVTAAEMPAQSRPAAATDIERVRRALAEGAGAAATAAVRRSIAALIPDRPAELAVLFAGSAGSGDATVGIALCDSVLLALLFAALPKEERQQASALAALLVGRRGRSAMSVEKVSAALAAAAAAKMRRRAGPSFSSLWLEAMLERGSAGERSALRRLLADHLPAMADLASGGRRTGGGRPAEAEKGSAEWWLQLVRDRPTGFGRKLRSLLGSREIRRRLCRMLPESLLAELLAAAGGTEARSMLAAAEAAAEAIACCGGSLSRAGLWDALLEAASERPGLERLLSVLFDGGERPGLSPPRGGMAAAEEALARRAGLQGQAALAAALEERNHDRRLAVSRRPAPPEPPPRLERKRADHSGSESNEERIAVGNAGLVLTGPFLPAFFTRLGLMAAEGEGAACWVTAEARDRGVHLLQYLVEGRCDRPEPALALNKLLCGQPRGHPTSAGIEPSEAERSICRSLLEAMLAAWPMLTRSSVPALQEIFLQREGRLVSADGGYRVEVERKVLDVLVDNVPWSFSLIYHRWMPEPLRVSW